MRTSSIRWLVTSALLVAGAPLLPAAATANLPGTRVVVTGAVVPVALHRAHGLAAGPALALAQLDRLAAEGSDPALLTAAGEQAFPDSFGPASSQVFLTAAGDLDGRSGRDVLEQRYSSNGSRDSLQLIARNGVTGAVLWTRTETYRNAFMVAVPTRVGAAQRPGVVLLAFTFSNDSAATELTALDGRGRQVWTRSAPIIEPAPSDGAGLGSSSSFAFTAVSFSFDRALRLGVTEVLRITETYSSSETNGVASGQSSSVSYLAISGTNGATRALAGGARSTTGVVTGTVVADQDGDGLDELATVDGGSDSATVRRAVDGAVVWRRTDLTTHGFGYLSEAGRLTGARSTDLVLTTGADPGRLGGLALPVLADPTAGAHGTVRLLRARTGATVWSKPGDAPYALQRAGVPSLGVLNVTRENTPTAAKVTATLEAFTSSGTSRWRASASVSAKTTSDETTPFTGAFAFPMSDLDGDRGLEGVLVLFAQTEAEQQVQSLLLGAADGRRLKDQTSDLLYGGVTRRGEDRVRVSHNAGGLVVTVLRGRDSRKLFQRALPSSKGVTSGRATAVALGGGCSDLLVSGSGGSRGVVGVLTSDGATRWTVGRAGTDLGKVARPRVAPRPRCLS